MDGRLNARWVVLSVIGSNYRVSFLFDRRRLYTSIDAREPGK